jgi:uncharacterized protein YkuJ
MLSLGAINKQTRQYVYPKIANKNDEYECPECRKELIVCKGEIRMHHFRHKIDSVHPCHHYSHPTESQIHKDAKQLMKTLLEQRVPLSFIRPCSTCKTVEEYEIPITTDSTSIHMEYRFEYQGLKIADVAYRDENEFVCIIEICNTHKTNSEKRPEPWFEVDATTLLMMANDDNPLQIPCIRSEKCDDCIHNEKESNKLKECRVSMKITFQQSVIKQLTIKQPSTFQLQRDKIIKELQEHHIMIDNLDEINKNSSCYYIEITHPILKQKISYHTKRKEIDKSKGYTIDKLISWYYSPINIFDICIKCRRVSSKNTLECDSCIYEKSQLFNRTKCVLFNATTTLKALH